MRPEKRIGAFKIATPRSAVLIVGRLLCLFVVLSPSQDIATLTAAKELLEAKKDIRFGAWKNDDIDILNEQQFLSAKPVVYLVNIGNEEYALQKNKYLAKVAFWQCSRAGW